jgi:hypothetical protein
MTATGGTETLGAPVAANGSGAVTLTATGPSSDIILNADVASGSGNISLTAGYDIDPAAVHSISTTGNVSLIAGNNIDYLSISAYDISLKANTVGVLSNGGLIVNPTDTSFGAVTVAASGVQNGVSAKLISGGILTGLVDPTNSAGAVFANGVPVDPATANLATASDAVGASTVSVSAERMANMAREAGFESFFFLARSPFGVASQTEGEEECYAREGGSSGGACLSNPSQIAVTEDGLFMIK